MITLGVVFHDKAAVRPMKHLLGDGVVETLGKILGPHRRLRKLMPQHKDIDVLHHILLQIVCVLTVDFDHVPYQSISGRHSNALPSAFLMQHGALHRAQDQKASCSQPYQGYFGGLFPCCILLYNVKLNT